MPSERIVKPFPLHVIVAEHNTSSEHACRMSSRRIKDTFYRHDDMLLPMPRHARALIMRMDQRATCNRQHVRRAPRMQLCDREGNGPPVALHVLTEDNDHPSLVERRSHPEQELVPPA